MSYTKYIGFVLRWLQSLVATFECLGDGRVPSSRNLEAASILDPCTVSMVAMPHLIGGNCGHPGVSEPIVRYGKLLALAPEFGWTRAHRHLYPLQSSALHEGKPVSVERQS